MNKKKTKVLKVDENKYRLTRTQVIDDEYTNDGLAHLLFRLKGDLEECKRQRAKLDDWEVEINEHISEIEAALGN